MQLLNQKTMCEWDQHPTNLPALARRCQQIEQQLKNADCTKFIRDRNAKQNAARKNGSGPNKAIVSVSNNSNVAFMQANSNLNSRMQQIF